MYLVQIDKLARYLMSPGLTTSESCKYLALETFKTIRPTSIYAAEISEDGCISPIGHFGLSKSTIEKIGSTPLTSEGPLVDAVKSDKVLLLDRESLMEKYPQLNTYIGLPDIWESYLVCPTLPYGVIAMSLNSTPKKSKEFESYLSAVGALTALSFKEIKECFKVNFEGLKQKGFPEMAN
jgi:hypothetical protein